MAPARYLQPLNVGSPLIYVCLAASLYNSALAVILSSPILAAKTLIASTAEISVPGSESSLYKSAITSISLKIVFWYVSKTIDPINSTNLSFSSRTTLGIVRSVTMCLYCIIRQHLYYT